VGRVELGLWPHVEHEHLAPLGLCHQFLATDAGQPVGLGHHLLQRQAQFQQVFFGHLAQGHAEVRHVPAAQAVDHALALAAALHQPRFLQRLQVRTGELDIDADLGGHGLHRLFPLGQHLQHLQPLRAGQGLAHAGDLFVQKVLERSVVHWYTF
jgi:hypothetical protein